MAYQRQEDLDRLHGIKPTQAQVNDAASLDWSARQNEAFDHIDAKARRDRIAEGFAFAIAAMVTRKSLLYSPQQIAKFAANYADALIAELDRA